MRVKKRMEFSVWRYGGAFKSLSIIIKWTHSNKKDVIYSQDLLNRLDINLQEC